MLPLSVTIKRRIQSKQLLALLPGGAPLMWGPGWKENKRSFQRNKNREIPNGILCPEVLVLYTRAGHVFLLLTQSLFKRAPEQVKGCV